LDRLDVKSTQLVDDRILFVVGGVVVESAQTAQLMPTDVLVDVVQLTKTI
jgi:hypothetical protein